MSLKFLKFWFNRSEFYRESNKKKVFLKIWILTPIRELWTKNPQDWNIQERPLCTKNPHRIQNVYFLECRGASFVDKKSTLIFKLSKPCFWTKLFKSIIWIHLVVMAHYEQWQSRTLIGSVISTEFNLPRVSKSWNGRW